MPSLHVGHGRPTAAHFDAASAEWRDVYEADTLEGVIYRARMEAALAWIDEIAPPAGARALDAGCGAGLSVVELGRRGYAVDAIDASPAMVELTTRHAAQRGVAEVVSARVGEVERLPFADDTFELVVALGVLPWVGDPGAALAELRRVLKPGGHAIVTADNRARLSFLLDPWANPFLVRVRQLRDLVRRRSRKPADIVVRFHWPSTFDRLVAAAGLEPIAARTVGFGPFTLHGRPLFSDAAGMRSQRRLQRLADRGVPGVRGSGSHYLINARKPSESGP